MQLEPEITFELTLEPFQKDTVRVKPRHFIFVFVGHQFEKVLRHRFGKHGRELRMPLFGFEDHVDEISIMTGIGVVLERGKVGRTVLDESR